MPAPAKNIRQHVKQGQVDKIKEKWASLAKTALVKRVLPANPTKAAAQAVAAALVSSIQSIQPKRMVKGKEGGKKGDKGEIEVTRTEMHSKGGKDEAIGMSGNNEQEKRERPGEVLDGEKGESTTLGVDKSGQTGVGPSEAESGAADCEGDDSMGGPDELSKEKGLELEPGKSDEGVTAPPTVDPSFTTTAATAPDVPDDQAVADADSNKGVPENVQAPPSTLNDVAQPVPPDSDSEDDASDNGDDAPDTNCNPPHNSNNPPPAGGDPSVSRRPVRDPNWTEYDKQTQGNSRRFHRQYPALLRDIAETFPNLVTLQVVRRGTARNDVVEGGLTLEEYAAAYVTPLRKLHKLENLDLGLAVVGRREVRDFPLGITLPEITPEMNPLLAREVEIRRKLHEADIIRATKEGDAWRLKVLERFVLGKGGEKEGEGESDEEDNNPVHNPPANLASASEVLPVKLPRGWPTGVASGYVFSADLNRRAMYKGILTSWTKGLVGGKGELSTEAVLVTKTPIVL